MRKHNVLKPLQFSHSPNSPPFLARTVGAPATMCFRLWRQLLRHYSSYAIFTWSDTGQEEVGGIWTGNRENWCKGAFLTWPEMLNHVIFSTKSYGVYFRTKQPQSNRDKSLSVSVCLQTVRETLQIFSHLHFWFIHRFVLTSHADVSKQRRNAQEETEGCLSQGQLKCGQIAILHIISKSSKNHSFLEKKEKIWGWV